MKNSTFWQHCHLLYIWTTINTFQRQQILWIHALYILYVLHFVFRWLWNLGSPPGISHSNANRNIPSSHTHTHTHTPGPEDAVVSDGNSRGRSAGLSVSRGARWAILPFPSAQAAFHLCLIPQRATYPPFTGSPSLSSWTAASRDHSLIKSWLLIFTAKQQKVRLLVWMPSALMLVCAEVTYILYSSLKVF